MPTTETTPTTSGNDACAQQSLVALVNDIADEAKITAIALHMAVSGNSSASNKYVNALRCAKALAVSTNALAFDVYSAVFAGESSETASRAALARIGNAVADFQNLHDALSSIDKGMDCDETKGVKRAEAGTDKLMVLFEDLCATLVQSLS